MQQIRIERVDFGYFVRPPEETGADVGKVVSSLGYLVGHPSGRLLFDTGIGAHPEADAHYRPRRITLPAALGAIGSSIDAVTHVANCHLHIDHIGGNPLLRGRPVFVQASELADATTEADYTATELLEDTEFEQLSGEAEILPNVWILPTPGHTPGHQSLIVRRDDGNVVVAGQSHDSATDYTSDQLSWRAHRDAHDAALPAHPEWVERLQALDPRAVYFAHDHSVWTP